MNNKFKIVVRTPEAEVVSTEAESLYVTTEVGDMMILPHHAAFSGVISFSPLYLKNGEHQEDYLVQRGLLFFSNLHNRAMILCNRCEKKESLDYHSIKDYLKFIEEKLEKGDVEALGEFQYKFLQNERLALVQQIEHLDTHVKKGG